MQEQQYVYEKEMEEPYRASLLKAFNKTLSDGFFPMVIVDAINNKVYRFCFAFLSCDCSLNKEDAFISL